MAYSATLAATGGTAPYNWSVKSGALPAGLSLSTAGAISGTPTAAGAASFTVEVTDSASMPQTADSGNLSLNISGGALTITSTTATAGKVGTPYTFQLVATGGVPPYTWALASGSKLPDGLSLSSAGVVSGTPTAAGSFRPNIAVTDETTTNTISGPVAFTINPAGTPLADGNYTFQFNGVAHDGNLVGINGSFQVASGTIGVGAYNETELNQMPLINQLFTGGSASIAANGLGQMQLTLLSGNITFALAAPASAKTAGSDSDIRIIEFDDTDGTGMRGSGVLKTSSVTNPPAAIKGGYAFGLGGADTHSQPAAVAGSFQADGAGHISSGSFNINDNGTLSSYSAVTGTYTTNPVGGGIITLKLSSTLTVTYSYSQVSPSELVATSADMTSSTIPLVSGSVLLQSGPFSKASLTGANVLETIGISQQTTTFIPDVSLGLLTSDGNGNATVSVDEFRGTLQPPQSFTATYTVDAASGQVTLATGGTPPIIYLVSSTKAFILSGGTDVGLGMLEGQSGSPFTNASLKGNYLGGTLQVPPLNVVSLVAPDGTGKVAFTSNTSGPSGLQTNVMLSGTYTVDATGRAVVTVTGDSTPRIFYVVSPTKTVLLSGESGGYLSSLEQ